MPDFDVTKALRILQRHEFEGVDEEVLESFISEAQLHLKHLQLKKKERAEFERKRVIQPALNVIDQWIGKGVVNQANAQNKVLCISKENVFRSICQELSQNYSEIILLSDLGSYMALPNPILSILTRIQERVQSLSGFGSQDPYIYSQSINSPAHNLNQLIRNASLVTFDPSERRVDMETYVHDVIDQAQAHISFSQALPDVLAQVANQANVELFIGVMSEAMFQPGLTNDILKNMGPLFKSSYFGLIIEGSREIVPEPLRSRMSYGWSL